MSQLEKKIIINEREVQNIKEKMQKATDFIKYALTHAKRESVPKDAHLPIYAEECGLEPWEYLYGTTGAAVAVVILNAGFAMSYFVASRHCVEQ